MLRTSFLWVILGLALLSTNADAKKNRSCQTEDRGKVEHGTTYTDENECQQYECLYGILTTRGCGISQAPAGCEFKEAKGPFPKCCPKLHCKNGFKFQ
ncbi:U-scoloptoxin(16)-Ssd1a-like [Parasteatoda tepidariorum]|uniref:U-scoloptoxin(16)-Ssd1a-like n=1 Tax=Parasteatoda tepidariorum TaxID=114398 RepID=UPI001C71F4C0|nr:U-scoloptoxin(16)-Ssd1a-like [Parasteatoda tepidariorum]